MQCSADDNAANPSDTDPGLLQDCELCAIGDDQYCEKVVMTYNGKDWGDHDHITKGGYSNRLVVNHKYIAYASSNLACRLRSLRGS